MTTTPATDAISLEVFKNLFAAVAEEMGVTLQRAAFSPNIRERLDFSCAIFDHGGRLVAQAAHIPVHLGSMPAAVSYVLGTVVDFAPGDVIILNDPFRGGTHLPDLTLVSPIFAAGELAFFAASRAHHADIGGMTPGSLPLSTELYQEGLIIPPVKLVKAGLRNEGVFDLLLANSRTPDERTGDLEAQLAAQHVGENRMAELVKVHGRARVEAHIEALIAYSRLMTEAVIEAIPDGQYAFTDALEGDGQTETPIPISVNLTVQGKRMIVDFAGTAPQVRGNLNAVEAIVRSATWYCVRLLADDDVPVNQGCFEPVQVITEARTLLNPLFPAAVAVGNTETSQRVVDCVLGALAVALPGKIPAASQGTMNNFTFGAVSGDRRVVYYETIGGGHGGSPFGAGLSGRHSHMTNTRNTSVEALEYDLPIRILEYSLRTGSGGAGTYPGGEGIRRVVQFLAPAMLTINSERRINQPYGLQGGAPGSVGRNYLIRAGVESSLGGKCTVQAQPGDILIIETPGGGGWGVTPL